jgi:hypothetical protein
MFCDVTLSFIYSQDISNFIERESWDPEASILGLQSQINCQDPGIVTHSGK